MSKYVLGPQWKNDRNIATFELQKGSILRTYLQDDKGEAGRLARRYNAIQRKAELMEEDISKKVLDNILKILDSKYKRSTDANTIARLKNYENYNEEYIALAVDIYYSEGLRKYKRSDIKAINIKVLDHISNMKSINKIDIFRYVRYVMRYL